MEKYRQVPDAKLPTDFIDMIVGTVNGSYRTDQCSMPDAAIQTCYFLNSFFASTAHLFVWQECAGRVHLSSEKRIISELKETSSWRERERERERERGRGIDAREGESRLNSHMRHNERAFNVWKGAMPLYCSFYLYEGKFAFMAPSDRGGKITQLILTYRYIKISKSSKSSEPSLQHNRFIARRTCDTKPRHALLDRVIKIDSI